jgi:hypothetical protein
VTAIAEQLTEEKVLIPSAYTAKYFPENCRNRSFSDPYRWNANTIGHILDRQEYLGHTVLGKSICENFKTKQRRAATPEELMIFPDTHEAIIDQDMGHCPEAPCSCKTESRKRNLFPPFVRHDLLCGLWFTNGIHQPRSKAKRKTL